jgi:plasmid stability protein
LPAWCIVINVQTQEGKMAQRHGRSLDAELREILAPAAKTTLNEMRERLDKMMTARFGDRVLSDSCELLRENRER